MDNLKKSLTIGGVFAAETVDKTGEIIDIKGMSIESLNDGTAILNSEHSNGQFSGYLGRIVGAKKIFKYEDCKTEHEKKCFESVGKVPLIYGTAALFDDEEGHTEAKHAAAVIRSFKKNNLPVVARFSIEGSSLEKEGNYIKRSIAKRCALTIQPANLACESEVISDLSKSEKDTYGHITKNYENSNGVITPELLVLDEVTMLKSLNDLQESFDKLQKALSAGMAVGGPGTRTGGAALQASSDEKPKKAKEETSEASSAEDPVLKPESKAKMDKIDAKVKDNLDTKEIKLKKAEVFIYKNLLALQKGK